MKFPLRALLTLEEADDLAQQYAFIRMPTESGTAYAASFMTAEDLRGAQLKLAALRSKQLRAALDDARRQLESAPH